ncbi:MAG: bifunctional [glutamine synthetase] adenylyltransferase/[glutamine synthetase]-adenylyl-L-tyrosine phosphorylase [Actinomycetota bacterium]|nr:bifunctional [glutamine synthetase] adenylyltransferase/[glutamine synthetase]-adenylyl-L-tyrosine phosphorylase [Actinomycetota bacterium]
MGFLDAARSHDHLLAVCGATDEVPQALAEALAAAPDPDLAATALDSLAAACAPGQLLSRLLADLRHLERLAVVLGTSSALGDFLVRHPELVEELADPALDGERPSLEEVRAGLLRAVGADPQARAPAARLDEAAGADALRVEYYRRLVRLAARDLTGVWQVDQVGPALADLAGATVEAALALARPVVGESAADCRLAVIGMGKTGGRELNYVSDVDVVFVAEPVEGADEARAMRAATRLASTTMRLCSAHTAEGTIWEVDANLRPEGRSGPLVRSLDSHVAYYSTWAKTWEFQALLKATPIAGDAELGRRYTDLISPMVWLASEREGFVADVQAMRRRVVDHIPAAEADRQLKLGPGGLRDVEFAVQLLQLVHGRGDESLRSPSTLVALQALTDGGYVGREDGAALAAAYRFLRCLEHRIQLFRLRRTHVVPTDEADLRRLGRSLQMTGDPVAELNAQWRRLGREVRRIHEKLFYRPLLSAVAALPGEGLRLGTQAAQARLTALGYADPRGALGHIEALSSGVSRRSAIQRQLLPAMLGWFADGPAPDAGLLAFRQLSDSLGSTHWFLRQLRDESEAAQQLARVLGSSRFVADMLTRAPEVVAMFGKEHELTPRSRDTLCSEMTAAARRHHEPVEAIRAVRTMRRRELARVAVRDVLGGLAVEDAAEALTDVTVATLSGALSAAIASVESERRGPLSTRIAVVTMGRLGGHETGYGSDADVMFVHVPHPGVEDKQATEAAYAVAQELRRMLGMAGAGPPLEVDAGLRPEGTQGPLARTLSSYAAYYRRWSQVWEAQALLRADPVVGDAEVCTEFAALIDPLRYPEGGLSRDDVVEIRRIKGRIDAERLPRGADPATHLKLGRGALADVEWTVQLLQLRHAHEVTGLRTTRTLPALQAAVDAGLVDQPDAQALADAWRSCSRQRNAIMLVRGRASDQLPSAATDRAAVAVLLGYGPDEAERMLDEHLRTTRRARSVVQRLFWD